jgi:Putative addiction module component
MTKLQAIETEATLLASLDTPEEIEAAWAEEIERRSADFKSRALRGIPAEIVLADVRALLK